MCLSGVCKQRKISALASACFHLVSLHGKSTAIPDGAFLGRIINVLCLLTTSQLYCKTPFFGCIDVMIGN